ncbi:uncharacterized protein K452DRAFT_64801 [Aplosporella prunicola CBS 121167]|uniref:Uncharacterized protein n=1 Tax=Aplosporella prunicola CBS 121167 TaxID=1176127 RepID=A0A6A6B8P5_9PEZI|nr:uncharacterized protein K452DRAFT_64801 [Aplosporella prunicola CBS 121167]KAF2139733.1 hypothetical protein K452DRAFT_64801 [Aplosporella prunicola CBS 121167]
MHRTHIQAYILVASHRVGRVITGTYIHTSIHPTRRYHHQQHPYIRHHISTHTHTHTHTHTLSGTATMPTSPTSAPHTHAHARPHPQSPWFSLVLIHSRLRSSHLLRCSSYVCTDSIPSGHISRQVAKQESNPSTHSIPTPSHPFVCLTIPSVHAIVMASHVKRLRHYPNHPRKHQPTNQPVSSQPIPPYPIQFIPRL